MEIKIYSIYDNKAEAYMEPFFATTAGLAIRRFADTANNPDTMLFRHPNDFALYEIGTFNDKAGTVNCHKNAKNLGLAAEYISKTPEHDDQMRLVK